MRALNEILEIQIKDIEKMLNVLRCKPKSQKQKEKAYYVLQSIQNKLDKLIK